MEKLSTESFRILIFILPGLVTLQFRRLLVVPEELSLLDTVIMSAVLTFLDHVLASVLPSIPGLAAVERGVVLDSEFWRIFQAQGGLRLLVYSGALGVLLGVLRFHGWDYAVLRSLRLTRRTGSLDVWNETFNRDGGSWLLITLKDGRRLQGWAATYSDVAGKHELFLGKAAWVADDGTRQPIDGPGILVTEATGIQTVEFWTPVP